MFTFYNTIVFLIDSKKGDVFGGYVRVFSQLSRKPVGGFELSFYIILLVNQRTLYDKPKPKFVLERAAWRKPYSLKKKK